MILNGMDWVPSGFLFFYFRKKAILTLNAH